MDRERFKKIKTIFHDALDLDGDERESFLRSACAGDGELRKKVDKLLSNEADSKSFLETPLVNYPDRVEDRSPLVGKTIGRYRLRRIISSGGMGTVYEAVQSHPRRTVAVKVMRRGFESDEAIRRFESEARILARLRHPNIAQVIEAGSCGKDGRALEKGEAGLPFFVMEYIPDALSVTEYARVKDLPVGDRLRLFVQACDAVYHGHQKGIIHRDLKPGNMLVDGRGRVKIIDFGVARAVESDPGQTAFKTAAGQLIGTLQYMSPEQCAADPHDLDTRSDVYALGVVLYELLCEELPYDLRKAMLVEALRQIREEPPKKPSSIKRVLRGDVETIVLKALEKKRRHRYQSVAEFGADIDRHLEGRVIRARSAGVGFRFWKWIRRNPKKSAAVGAALVSLLSFVGYMLFWAYPRIKAEKDKVAEAYRWVTGLSDVKVLRELEAEARELKPAHPRKIAHMSDWIERAEALRLRIGGHKGAIGKIRATAPRPSGRWEPSSPWTFADTETQWQHDTLDALIGALNRFFDPQAGLLSVVARRLSFARLMERTWSEHEAAWDRAVASIADLTRCPQYGGIVIAPKIGFVPIGRDPDSGLWEFAHLQTGEIPRRGADGRLELTEKTGLIFVLLPPGSVTVGERIRTFDDWPLVPNILPLSDYLSVPIHRVEVDAFFISKYEMTQGQWLRLTGRNPSVYKAGGFDRDGRPFSLLNPVESVSWIDCSAELPFADLRLPTEAEWLHASRAGTTTLWWTGDYKESLFGAANIRDLSCRKFDRSRNYCETWSDGFAAHGPVGSFRPNPFGLHDVLGNVYEWCHDADIRYEVTFRESASFQARSAIPRIYRGGSWIHYAEYCRSDFHDSIGPENRYFDLGVRPAADLR